MPFLLPALKPVSLVDIAPPDDFAFFIVFPYFYLVTLSL
jgi:hypothetical protein